MTVDYLLPSLRSVLGTFQSTEPYRRLPKDIEERFFTCLRMQNGTAKTTYSHRLHDLNKLADGFWPSVRPLRVMDVGVSSGVSTLEWMEFLEARGIDHHMFAIDLMIRGVLIRLREGVDVLTNMMGSPVMIDLHGKWVPYPAGKRNWVRHCLSLAAIRGALFVVGPQAVRFAEQGNRAERPRFASEIVSLVYGELKAHPQVTLIEGNIADPRALPRDLHVIRAANILNRGYFQPAQLTAVLRNLRASLCGGGLLIVGRTDDDGRNTGTVFSLSDGGLFEVAGRINGGSEIEDLACALTADPAPK